MEAPNVSSINQKLLDDIFINELKYNNINNKKIEYSTSSSNNYILIEDFEDNNLLVMCSLKDLEF